MFVYVKNFTLNGKIINIEYRTIRERKTNQNRKNSEGFERYFPKCLTFSFMLVKMGLWKAKKL